MSESDLTTKLLLAAGSVVVTYIAYRVLFGRPRLPANQKFGITLPGAKGETDIHRSPLSERELIDKLHNGATSTLYENFKTACERHGDKAYLGTRVDTADYTWETYNQVKQRAKNLGSGLLQLGATTRSSIGIFSVNRAEWTITDHACACYSLVSVPLYDTLGAESVEYIINLSEISIVLCSKDKLKLLLDVVAKCAGLKHIVLFDKYEEADAEDCKQRNITLRTFKEVERIGADNPKDFVPPSADDLATICFTSGTTGLPKGAMLTHKNLVADAAGALASGVIVLFPEDIHISYLPLAHMFERIVHVACVSVAASIGFFRGDVRAHLFDDVAVLKPTIFCSVPRLFNRIYDKVMAGVNSSPAWKKNMFKIAYETKKKNLVYDQYTHPLWDFLVFNKIKKLLGGRVRYMVTGSAPLSSDVLEFLRICFCCPVAEGYGQTECSAACTASVPGHPTVNNVGIPLPCAEVKLVDVPEMNYFATNDPPAGEVCVRGPCVFTGYYRDPEKTKEALDANGWLHSGDIGCWLPDGTLRIIDRKKNLFKLSHGEYIAPEKIENINVSCSFISQSFVYGSSLKSSVVAVVVPDPEVVTKWAKANSIDGSFEDLCKKPELKKAILDELTKVGKANKLKGFELIRDIYIDHDPFSVEKDILTPTFKLKRQQASAYYKKQLIKMIKMIN